jgi:hypothetical protein
MPKKPVDPETRAAAAALGRKGGTARAKKLSAKRRAEIAKKAAETRSSRKVPQSRIFNHWSTRAECYVRCKRHLAERSEEIDHVKALPDLIVPVPTLMGARLRVYHNDHLKSSKGSQAISQDS